MAAIEVPHHVENQMFTSKPVGDRMRGTAIRVPITDGPHTLIEEGAPTSSILQNNARLDQLEQLLTSANDTISQLTQAVGLKVAPPSAASVATAAVAASSAAPSATDEVAALEAQLAAAKAKLTGTDTYQAPAA